MKSLRVALAAEESAGVQALKLIAEPGHDPVLVLTSVGDRRSVVATAAEELDVPVAPAELVTDPALAERLVEERVDLLLNIHALHVVSADVLGAPEIGSFNLHPGPLPEYAGLNVPSWAIYRGEHTHAVTLHWMSPRIDAGPIAYAESFEITPDDTGLSLTVRCARRGMGLISRLLEDAAADPDRIPGDEQDLGRRRYYDAGPPGGGRVPWFSPARRVVDLIRASDYFPFESPWGHPSSQLGDRRIELLRASLSGEVTGSEPGTVRADGEGSVLVAAADEWVVVERVVVSGESRGANAALKPGDRLDPGDRGEGPGPGAVVDGGEG